MGNQDCTVSPNEDSNAGQEEGGLPSISRRNVMAGVGFFGAAIAAIKSNNAWAQGPGQGSYSNEAVALPPGAALSDADAEITAVKIARAMRAGPLQITRDATVAEMDRHGHMTILRKGTNDWICMPGDENRIGDPPMCVDRVGMQWFQDIHDRKPKPSITTPGLCYMLCGATQHSNDDALDTTSAAIPIGPHWMVLWPFDSKHCGLPTDVRDAGAWIMFSGTPYAYLHICGSPWVGNSYSPGDQPLWTMQYVKA